MSDDPKIKRDAIARDEMSGVRRLTLTFPSSGVFDLEAMLQAIRSESKRFDLETIRAEIAAYPEAEKPSSKWDGDDDNGHTEIDGHLKHSIQRLVSEIESLLEENFPAQHSEDLYQLIALSIRLGARRKEQQMRAKVLKQVKVGAKIYKANRDEADRKRGKIKPQTIKVIEAMRELVNRGQSASSAASIVHKRGLGPSTDANRKAFYRHSN